MLPGVEHTGNSQVVAFVTDDQVKARKVGEQYGVSQAYRYDQYAKNAGNGRRKNWFAEATFDKVARSFTNPDWVDVTLHSYRSRWGEADPDPTSAWLESALAIRHAIFAAISRGNKKARKFYACGPYAQDRGRTIADSPEKSSDSEKGAAKSAAINPELAELLANWSTLPAIIKSAILAVARPHFVKRTP